MTSPSLQPELDLRSRGRHFEKSIWCHNSSRGGLIWMKFDRPMQNHMPLTTVGSKAKPEVKFHYGGRLFFWNRYYIPMHIAGISLFQFFAWNAETVKLISLACHFEIVKCCLSKLSRLSYATWRLSSAQSLIFDANVGYVRLFRPNYLTVTHANTAILTFRALYRGIQRQQPTQSERRSTWVVGRRRKCIYWQDDDNSGTCDQLSSRSTDRWTREPLIPDVSATEVRTDGLDVEWQWHVLAVQMVRSLACVVGWPHEQSFDHCFRRLPDLDLSM